METAQVGIEAVADLFERKLDLIVVADCLFVYDDAEGPNALMYPSENMKGILDDSEPEGTGHRTLPNALPTAGYDTGVQLDIMGITEP